MAVVDGLRRLPLGQQPRSTAPSASRDIDIATRSAAAGATATRGRTKTRSTRRSRAMPLDELTQLHDSVVGAVACAAQASTLRCASRRARKRRPASSRCRRSSRRIESGAAGAAARCVRSGSRRRWPTTGELGAAAPRIGVARRRQVAAGCHPGAGRGGGVLQADRAVEPDSAVPGACEASGVQGFSRGAGRHRPGGGRAGAGGRRVEKSRASSRQAASPGGGSWPRQAVRSSSRAIAPPRADRVRRRAVRRGEEDSAAVRHGRAGRSVGQAGASRCRRSTIASSSTSTSTTSTVA